MDNQTPATVSAADPITDSGDEGQLEQGNLISSQKATNLSETEPSTKN